MTVLPGPVPGRTEMITVTVLPGPVPGRTEMITGYLR